MPEAKSKENTNGKSKINAQKSKEKDQISQSQNAKVEMWNKIKEIPINKTLISDQTNVFWELRIEKIKLSLKISNLREKPSFIQAQIAQIEQ